MRTITGALASGTTSPSPGIECWPAEGDANGIGLLVFPGGSYTGHTEHEASGYARRFSAAGIACFVVRYRLGSASHRHPEMLEDALAAIGTVRSRAAEFSVDPGALGVIGSSAGGHLAAHALVAWRKYPGDVSLRPDFGVLCYPVIAARGPYAHAESIRNLAGVDPSPGVLEELSCEAHVSSDTPPCYLWHTGPDRQVPLENSTMFAAALRKHGVPFELHLYARGGHGVGLDAPFPWADDCLRWMRDITGRAGACG
jgi:acetyl esterase/lipase